MVKSVSGSWLAAGPRRWTSILVLIIVWRLCGVQYVYGQTIARCGDGWLEQVDGYRVLHLKGTPYEMGYQHGALLKQSIHDNLDHLLKVKGTTKLKLGPLTVYPRAAIETISRFQQRHTPPKYFEELDGLADAAGVSQRDARMANFIPELFHCSGFAVMNSATHDGAVYHGRVLDYAIDWQLQDHAVLIVAEPEGELPFVNVTYAGFIGSVTGMNAQGISIGEMGGRALGRWEGMPMAFLVREVLQTARDLDSAVDVFKNHKRTCQYYYVIADGKRREAVGIEATWQKVEVVAPGQFHALLPHPVPDAVLLSAGKRYQELVRRAKEGHGTLTPQTALRLMDLGVAMKSNLHNVLFAPGTLELWVANASHDRQPAATQKYQAFDLGKLLSRRPDAGAPQLALEPRKNTAAEKSQE